MSFPIKITNKVSFILILNIYTKAMVNYDTLIEIFTSTNIISAIPLTIFNFCLF